MDFVVGLPKKQEGTCLSICGSGQFSKRCIHMPCKNTMKGQEATIIFFEKAWVHFGYQRASSQTESRFLNAF